MISSLQPRATMLGLIAMFCMASHAPTAVASVIAPPATVGFFGGSTGTGSAIITTLTPGGSAGNSIAIDKEFLTFTSPGSQFTYALIGGSGATKYLVTDTVTNSTSSTWNDYHINVGCGSIGDIACSASGSGPVNFDLGVAPTIAPGPGVPTQNAWMLTWTGISVAPAATTTFTFGLETCAGCVGGWDMVQYPSLVPEPASASLLLAGLGVIASLVLKRRGRGD